MNNDPDRGANATPHVLVGMGGWELPSFRDVFYPSKMEKGFRKLEFYSRFFDLIEVNATFYNTSLSPNQARQWLEDVRQNPNFTFSVKLFRGFTHTFDATKEDALAVHRLLEPLRAAEKLAGLVIQFSDSFQRTREREAYLWKLRTAFPEDVLFLDVRHRSWDDPSFYEFCRDNGLNLINVDLPQMRAHRQLQENAWEGIAYFRMMGRNAEAWNGGQSADRYRYFYSDAELEELRQHIKISGAHKTFVVFHNDPNAFSLVNGLQTKNMLTPGSRLHAPGSLVTAFPQLKKFCDPVESGPSLFPF